MKKNNTNGILLSVIVANYNNESYIKDCLESIMSQTYKDLEIVVSDDCSTDNSLEIAKGYEKKYPGIIKVISSAINRGVARTRHEAILQANGHYITTLDSDDYYYDSQKLQREMHLIRFHKETRGKEIIAYSNIVIVREDKQMISEMGKLSAIKEGMIFNDIISRSCMIPRDFIMAKSLYFKAGGYNFSLRTHEDWDLKIRLSRKYEFFYTHHNGTAYRKHAKGLSSLPYIHRTNNLWWVFSYNYLLVPKESRKWVKERFLSFMKTRDRQFLKAAKTGGLLNTLKLHINQTIWVIWLKLRRTVDIDRHRTTNEIL